MAAVMAQGVAPRVDDISDWRAPLLTSSASDARYGLSIYLQFLPPPMGDMDDADADEMFGYGVGLAVELDYLFSAPVDLAWGAYASLGGQGYFGELTADIGSQEYEMDGITTFTMLVGVKVARRPSEGIQLEARAGVGFIYYASTDGLEGGLFMEGPTREVIEATTAGIFELGGRIGFPLGLKSALQLGAFFRAQGGPDPGEVEFDSTMLTQIGIDLGFLFQF